MEVPALCARRSCLAMVLSRVIAVRLANGNQDSSWGAPYQVLIP